MCGIIGILGKEGTDVAPSLLQGLKSLEYRGYDSAGMATLTPFSFHCHRAPGKLFNLELLQKKCPLKGPIGIAHTRWATHGLPTERNAHPHWTERVALVHNGIIENDKELRTALEIRGVQFKSETDTETILHLIDQELQKGSLPLQAVQETLKKIKGAYAFAILFKDYPEIMIGARRGSPLTVGIGQEDMYLGSDSIALSHLTNRFIYLEENDIVVLKRQKYHIYDVFNHSVQRPIRIESLSPIAFSKGKFAHFMAKEIHEQPARIRQTLEAYLSPEKSDFELSAPTFKWEDVTRLTIIACGTAYYAGLIAKYWFESIARLPIEIDIASEFRYRSPPLPEKGIALFISQSGETADTLAAHAYAKRQNYPCLAIVNVAESTLVRSTESIFMTYAGPEIGVASTKAFTTQLLVLAILVLKAAYARQTISLNQYQQFLDELIRLPVLMEEILMSEPLCRDIAYEISKAHHVLYLGRGTNYALALEGALKLKEISYIHAEGYAAGELKHGPIALVDDSIPLIVIAPSDALFDKTASNIQEVIARKGHVILISDEKGHNELSHLPLTRLILPQASPLQSPLLYALPIQLLAYHTAVIKGTDVDQPRNLAKSVTVE